MVKHTWLLGRFHHIRNKMKRRETCCLLHELRVGLHVIAHESLRSSKSVMANREMHVLTTGNYSGRLGFSEKT